jgi:hypothetical protein
MYMVEEMQNKLTCVLQSDTKTKDSSIFEKGHISILFFSHFVSNQNLLSLHKVSFLVCKDYFFLCNDKSSFEF